jgi:L-fuculose-phosphate aldolase
MTDTLDMEKKELMDRSKVDMVNKLKTNLWNERQKLALTCRILFDQGHDSGLAGQITARCKHRNGYYTQQFGLGFDEITSDNILLVDENLNVLEGDGMPNPANRFHTWIYREKPHVNCIIHTHPYYISALSLLERPLIISHMDSCMLYEDVSFLKNWPGVPVGNEEGKIISAVLGNNRAALLSHHGVIVACQSIEEACVLAIQCERSARLQLLAESCGEIQPIDSILAREAHDWILQEKRSQATFDYYARRILRELKVTAI